ncbi:Adenosine receptor A1 [Plecturocebus cupreus]
MLKGLGEALSGVRETLSIIIAQEKPADSASWGRRKRSAASPFTLLGLRSCLCARAGTPSISEAALENNNWASFCRSAGSSHRAGYKMVVTPRRAAVAIAGCWILSFVVGLTPMFGWNNLSAVEQAWVANGSVGEPVIKCEFEKVISMEYMVYFNFFVWVLPPLLLMVLIYLEVFYLIRKQLNKKVSASSGDPQKYYGKELKIAKSLALILFLFALSWLPLHILNCITLFCPSCHKPSILTYIAIFLTHGNSAMNPIVYAFRIQKFRVTFLKIWNEHFRCQPTPRIDEDLPEERPDD